MPWPLAPDTAVGVREGDTTQVLPADHDPLAVTELQHMLQDPGCWRADGPDLVFPVNTVRVLSDHGPVTFSADQGWAASSRRDLARRLQLPESGLRLCRADLLEQDYSHRGDTVVAVYVVRPAPDEHAHEVPQPVICFLDLRPLLLDISWMCLEQPWLDYNSLLARFAPRCPPGYEIRCSTGTLDPAPRYQGLPIIDGQVVVIDFVPQGSNTNGWPFPHPPASGSPDPGDRHPVRSVRPGGMRAPPAGGPATTVSAATSASSTLSEPAAESRAYRHCWGSLGCISSRVVKWGEAYTAIEGLHGRLAFTTVLLVFAVLCAVLLTAGRLRPVWPRLLGVLLCSLLQPRPLPNFAKGAPRGRCALFACILLQCLVFWRAGRCGPEFPAHSPRSPVPPLSPGGMRKAGATGDPSPYLAS
eukprot:s1073_g18.t1